jgi:uncharacterized protein
MNTTLSSTIQDTRFSNIGALIVKVTHRCNLDCSYCYENISKGNDMPLEVFKELVDRVMENTSKEKVAFIFHGGEPTIIPNEWYREAIRYANYKAVLCKKSVRYSLQTNLISITEDQLRIYNELDINLGVSVDGPADIPSPYRKRAEKVIKNLNLVKLLGIRFGILLNINQTNYLYFKRIMSWLENDLDVRLIKTNVSYAVGHGKNLTDMNPEQIYQAYADILEYMINTKGKKVVEENMAVELLRFFSYNKSDSKLHGLCGVQGCGAGKEVLGVTTEGNILPCGRFEWNNEDYFLGKLNEQVTNVVYEKYLNLVKDFQSLSPNNWFNCESCSAKKICSYGCQAFIVRSTSKINVECIPTKMRFEYMQKKRLQLSEVVEGIKQIPKFADAKPTLEYADNAGDNPNYNDSYDDDRD